MIVFKIGFLAVFTIVLAGCTFIQSPAEITTPEVATPTVVTEKEPQDSNVTDDAELDLHGKQLERIPAYVFDLKNVEKLDVSQNRITGAIQAEIRHLSKLKVLNASNNQMTGLPAETGQLQYLEVLNLANNQLTGLPYELGNLKNLQVLDLSGNQYSEYDLNKIMETLPATVQIIK